MAIRIQLRRDTAANWVSSNPVLRQGEIGIETDTLQMKLGNGTNTWTQITAYMNLVPDGNLTIGDYVMVNDIGAVSGVVGLDGSKNALIPGSSIIVEGPTDNSFETTLTVTDPTADRTITFKNADGTVAFVSDIPSTTDTLTEGSTNKYFSDELAQDAVATALAAGTHTNMTVSYNDASNAISLAAAAGYTNEEAVDAVAAALAAGTHTNISVSYNDAGNAISLTGAVTYSDENAQDAIGNALGTGLSYNDTTGAISVDTTAIQAKVANVDDTEIGYLNGVTSGIQTQIDSKASSASPTFTGTATLGGTGDFVINGTSNIRITPASGSNAYIGTASSDNIIATAAGLNLKAPLASPTFTGTVTIPSGASISGFAPLASPTFTGTVSAADLTLSGNLTVNGTTTNLNSTNLVIEDKNIVLGDTTTPTDVTADGGGITLKGTTDKTLNWVDATDAWTSSEHVNLASGKSLYLNGTLLKDATETLTNKTLTSPVINTPTGITKSDVGLANVDNTTDAGKPVSAATQTALDLKLASATAATTYAPIASPTFTGTVTIPSGASISGFAPLASPTFTTPTLGAATATSINTLTVGLGAGSISTNTAVGSSALAANTTGTHNVALGKSAALTSTTSSDITAVGYNALTLNTGSTNTGIGSRALASNTTGTSNTAVGNEALAANTTAGNNVAIGKYAMQISTTSSATTAVGNASLQSLTTGADNNAFGYASMYRATTAQGNVAIGGISLFDLTTGTYNVALGQGAGSTLTTGSENIIIGRNAAPSSITVSNQITLGNSSITTFRIPGLSISATTTALTVPSLTPTNAIGAIYGGTGLTTYTTGDILYSSASNTLSKLAAGTDGYILTLAAGIPSWAAAPITLPSQTGNSGYYLTTNGTSASWGALVVPITTGTATVSANTATTVDTTALSAFTSIEYMVSLKQGSKVRTSKVVVQTDGTSVDMTEFAITETGGTIAGVVISAAVVSTNGVLQLTVTDAATTNVTVKFSKVAL